MAMASDSSLDSADLDGRCSCPHCNARMSSINYVVLLVGVKTVFLI